MEQLYIVKNIHKADIIGDIHGCYEQLVQLLQKLGYEISEQGLIANPIEDRKLIFLGDLSDRGPARIKVLKLVMDAVERGIAISARGNHDDKLFSKLSRNKEAKGELLKTIQEIDEQGEAFRKRLIAFLDSMPYQIIIDNDNVVIAHGGMKEELQGESSNRMKAFAIYGDPTGEFDEHNRPILYDWVADYHGERTVVYGHIITEKAEWRNNTIDIDTGCYQTGILTALQWPEKALVDTKELN